jgi:hypothetical protein
MQTLTRSKNARGTVIGRAVTIPSEPCVQGLVIKLLSLLSAQAWHVETSNANSAAALTLHIRMQIETYVHTCICLRTAGYGLACIISRVFARLEFCNHQIFYIMTRN